jgi:hypothetical protein
MQDAVPTVHVNRKGSIVLEALFRHVRSSINADTRIVCTIPLHDVNSNHTELSLSCFL